MQIRLYTNRNDSVLSGYNYSSSTLPEKADVGYANFVRMIFIEGV